MQNTGCTSDQFLLEQIKNGSHAAFESLYDRYITDLFREAHQKLGDAEIAKDITHEIFLSLWENRHHLHINTSVKAYLLQSIRYKVIDQIQKGKLADKYLDHLQVLISQNYSHTDHRLREHMLQNKIDLEIEKLPSRMRNVFQLSRREHLSHSKIAEMLNLSEQTVRSHIKHALRILRSKLTLSIIVFLFLL